ncbi:MAG TPA: homocysteine S-methyltransferase family protein [Solirubrobacteraceae bacterium]|nr:homocysteine S-methyltransferase family protein [Solirubrobacteraceae bacterium]
MIADRATLPQLEHRPFLTDSGLETTLIFNQGVDLPSFAAFVLLETADGRRRLRHYFERHAEIAREAGCGFIAEAPTWRANLDWARGLGYNRRSLNAINQSAITLLADLRDRDGRDRDEYLISGCIGPRGDGYDPSREISAEAAEQYHAEQIATFALTQADLVSALTITNTAEAIGITRAARNAAMPVVISFTLETDGRLPSGERLGEAILCVDGLTDHGPAYYMINCAHPTHLERALEEGGPWLRRLRGFRANASCKSHAELDAATELDDGDPHELASEYAGLTARFPELTILGGCCGTDERHIEQIARACITSASPRMA